MSDLTLTPQREKEARTLYEVSRRGLDRLVEWHTLSPHQRNEWRERALATPVVDPVAAFLARKAMQEAV